jgi:NTE family protein
MFSILALGGGGLKGCLEIGAIRELERRFGPLHLKFKDGIYGCSIGSIIATCIAFGVPTDKIQREFMEFGSITSLFGTPSFKDAKDILLKKGVYDMKPLDDYLIKRFHNVGIDITSKKLGDALIPLRINASNLTKGVPTIFQGDIPVLSAIKASSCIPFVFRPQIINQSVYIDGGFITNVLLNLIPKEDRDRTLAISIIHTRSRINADQLELMNPLDYAYRLYKTTCLYEHHINTYPNNINLYYSDGSGLSTFTTKQKEEMILVGQTLTSEFFRSKCGS